MRRTSAIVVLVLSASLFACEPPANDAGAGSPEPAASSPTPTVADTTPAAPAGPAPSYPKAAPASGDAMVEAFYPSPMLVHRCLGLASSGSADRVKDVCERALRLDPGNEQIQAALATP